MSKTAEEMQAGVLDAISSAVEQATPPDVLAAKEESNVSAQQTADAGTGTGEGTPAGAGDGSDPATAGNKEAPTGEEGKGKKAGEETPDPESDRGDGRNASGRFVKKEGETDADLEKRRAADPDDQKGKKKPAAEPEIDPATGKPKVAAAKKADHVNDPIPDEIKGRTRERMEGLVSVAKTLTTERDTLKAERDDLRATSDEFMGMIEASGIDVQGFANTMELMRRMSSPQVVDRQAAVRDLRAAADKIAVALGETPAGKDPLEGHPDLKELVEIGDIKLPQARELAEQRNRAKAAERIDSENRQREQQQNNATTASAKMRDNLNALSDELRKRDGEAVYAGKHQVLVPIIKRLQTTIAPDKLIQAVREAYDALPAAAKPGPRVGDEGQGAANRAPAGTGAQQPARAKQGAGAGGAKVPTNPLEALELGLEHERLARGRG